MNDFILQEHLRAKLEDLRRGEDEDRSSFINYYESELLYRLGDIYNAKKFLLKAIKQSPTDPHYWYNLGRIYQDLGKNQSAIRVYSRAVKLQPTLTDALYNMSAIYRKTNRYQDMLAIWDKILTINPEEDHTLISYGIHYFERGEISKAFKYFQLAVSYHEEFYEVLRFVGLQYFKIGDFVTAQSLLEKAYSKEQRDSKVVQSLAEIYTSQLNIPKAYQLWSHLLTLEPKHKEALFQLSKLKITEKDSDIIEFLEGTITIHPSIILQLVKEKVTDQLKITKEFQELLSKALIRQTLLNRPIYADALQINQQAKLSYYSNHILDSLYRELSELGFKNINFVYDDICFQEQKYYSNRYKNLIQKGIIQSIGRNKQLHTTLPEKAMETNGLIISNEDYSTNRMDRHLLEYLEKNTVKYEFKKTGIYLDNISD